MRDIGEITGDVLNVALRLQRDVRPGLLKPVYETLVAQRLQTLGYRTERQKRIGAEFEGVSWRRRFGLTSWSRNVSWSRSSRWNG